MQEGSATGEELFNIFINNVDQGVKEMFNTFADNTQERWLIHGRGKTFREISVRTESGNK